MQRVIQVQPVSRAVSENACRKAAIKALRLFRPPGVSRHKYQNCQQFHLRGLMKRFEKLISGLIIGSVFPLGSGLLSVTIWLLFDKSENRPLIYVISGLSIGGLIDLKFLKRWINHRYNLPIGIIASLYLFYNVFVYGFFMGFPVLNTFLGLFAGYYFGNRICFKKVESEKHPKIINQVSIFTGLVMTFVSISSGCLAIYNNGAAGMIQDVLGLHFEITSIMLWIIVLTGGLTLISANILLTRLTMITAIKNFVR